MEVDCVCRTDDTGMVNEHLHVPLKSGWLKAHLDIKIRDEVTNLVWLFLVELDALTDDGDGRTVIAVWSAASWKLDVAVVIDFPDVSVTGTDSLCLLVRPIVVLVSANTETR